MNQLVFFVGSSFELLNQEQNLAFKTDSHTMSFWNMMQQSLVWVVFVSHGKLNKMSAYIIIQQSKLLLQVEDYTDGIWILQAVEIIEPGDVC